VLQIKLDKIHLPRRKIQSGGGVRGLEEGGRRTLGEQRKKREREGHEGLRCTVTLKFGKTPS